MILIELLVFLVKFGIFLKILSEIIDYITTTRHENVDSLLYDFIEHSFVSFKDHLQP